MKSQTYCKVRSESYGSQVDGRAPKIVSNNAYVIIFQMYIQISFNAILSIKGVIMKNLTAIFKLLLFPFLFLMRFVLFQNSNMNFSTVEMKVRNNVFSFAIFMLLFGFANTLSAASNTPAVSLSCSPNPITEGNSGNTPVTCTVGLNVAPDGKDIGLTIQTTNGTATTQNTDYIELNTNFKFIENTTALSQTFTVNIIGDATVEPDESFTVSVVNYDTNPSQNFTPPAAKTVTIKNDDGSEISVDGIADGATDASFGNALVSGETIDKTYTIRNTGIGNLTLGTVTASGDFSITAQPAATVASEGQTTFTVRFDPTVEGVRSGTVSFANNDADENPYNFNVSGAGLVSKVYNLTVDSIVVSENAGTANISIRIDPAMQSGDSLEVHWETSNDTATAGSDYTASSGTMTITSTSTNIFTIPILDDLIAESQEILNTALSSASMVSNPSNSTVSIATGAGTITINDDDSAGSFPTLSIGDRSLAENGGNMVFTVTRSAQATSDVVFSYTTVDGTASAPDDYTLTSGTGVISAGTSTTTISVPIINDIMAGEIGETFNVVLSNPSSGTELGDAIAVGTILDDDTGLTFAIGDAQIAEKDFNISAIVRVYFSTPLPNDINITYHTSDGTAITPDDYGALTQTATVPLGSTFYDITVIITGDTISEAIEEFYVTLDSTTNGTIAKNQSKVTIFDNDGVGGCSSYVGMLTINEYQNNPNYKDGNHPLADIAGKVPGNYIEIKYLDFLVKQYISNLWTISVVTSTGKFSTKYWNDADLLCHDPRYEIFQMDSNVMGAQGYVVIKDAAGNEVDILNISTPNNTLQQCQNFLYDTDFESSAQNKDIYREPDGTGDWVDQGNGANSGGSRCINRGGTGGESVYTEFDAIDTDEPLPLLVINQLSVPVKTKIVNQPFNLNIIDINTSTGILTPVKVDIKAYLGDAIAFTKLPGISNTGKDVNFYNQSAVAVNGFGYDKAIKATRVLFEYCENSAGKATNWNTCWTSNTQADLDKRRISFSRDTFAIRPDRFDVNIAADAIFKAGQETNFTFRALDGMDNASAEYNETQNASFVVDLNVSKMSCPIKNLTISPYVQFADGTHQDDFSFNDIGDINMSVHETVGSEFAFTDTDDTPVDTRLITEHNVSFRVIPHHFNMEVNLTDRNSDTNLTYLHDIHSFDDNYEMGAMLEANISAMHYNDVNVTRNYIDICYAQDTNLTLILNGTTITYPGSAAPLTHFLYYNPVEDDGVTLDGGEGNVSLLPVTNGMSLTSLTIENNASSFPASGDKNGTTTINYKLNFDRKQHLVVNPVRLKLSDVNITDTDGVEGSTAGPILNQNATLYYARVRPSKFFYGGNTVSPVTTPIFIDVYCDLGFTACDDYGINTVSGQINEDDWWLSWDHSRSQGDGNITLIASTNGDVSAPPKPNIDASEGADTTVEVTYGMNPLPYIVDIEFETDNTAANYTNAWLIYNKYNAIVAPSPFYRVEFIGISRWAGHGDTGHVVDSDTSTKKNERVGW